MISPTTVINLAAMMGKAAEKVGITHRDNVQATHQNINTARGNTFRSGIERLALPVQTHAGAQAVAMHRDDATGFKEANRDMMSAMLRAPKTTSRA